MPRHAAGVGNPRRRVVAAAAATVALALSALGAPAAEAATCGGLGEYPGRGYFTSLKASGIGCAGARDVMRGHYRCRVTDGRKGRCPSFRGWRCTEKRQTIPTEYNARVTCRRSGRTVIYTYNQDT